MLGKFSFCNVILKTMLIIMNNFETNLHHLEEHIYDIRVCSSDYKLLA